MTRADPRDVLVLWTITYDPDDHPGKYVVRGADVAADGARSHRRCIYVGESLVGARASIPPGLDVVPRDPEDDPVVVESWL